MARSQHVRSKPALVQSLETRRLLASSLPDISYGSGATVGSATIAASNSVVLPLSDGRALYASLTRNSSGVSTLQLRRLTSGGSGDGSFGTSGIGSLSLGTTVSALLQKITVDTSGRPLVVAQVRKPGVSNPEVNIVRFTTVGIPDSTFGTGGLGVVNFTRSPSSAINVALDSTSRVYVGASTRGTTGNSDLRIGRLGSNGKTDTTWGTGGTFITDPTTGDDQMYDLQIGSDGKAVVGFNAGAIANQPRVIRLNANGTSDGTFAASLSGLEQFQLLPTSDGKTLVIAQDATSSSPARLVLQRLNTNGTTDTTYTSGGKRTLITSASIGLIQRVLRASDGTLFIAGTQPGTCAGLQQPFVLAINPSLNLDGNFGFAGALTPAQGLTANSGEAALVGSDRLVVGFPLGAVYSPTQITLYKYVTNFTAGTAALVNGQVAVFGTSGNDTITVSPGASSGQVSVKINSAAAQTFTATAVNVYAQAGADKVSSTATAAVLRVLGGAGNDSLTGSNGNDYLNGEADNDSIDGGLGNDVLVAGTGLNTLNGGDGNDSFFAKNGSKDILNGGIGTDTAQSDSGVDSLTLIETNS